MHTGSLEGQRCVSTAHFSRHSLAQGPSSPRTAGFVTCGVEATFSQRSNRLLRLQILHEARAKLWHIGVFRAMEAQDTVLLEQGCGAERAHRAWKRSCQVHLVAQLAFGTGSRLLPPQVVPHAQGLAVESVGARSDGPAIPPIIPGL